MTRRSWVVVAALLLARGVTAPAGATGAAGERLVYEDALGERGAVVVADRDARTLRRLPGLDPWDPVLSPDRRTIAYTDRLAPGQPSQLVLARTDGRGQRWLTLATGDVFHPSWSPDGTKLVYADAHRDWVVPAGFGGFVDSCRVRVLDVRTGKAVDLVARAGEQAGGPYTGSGSPHYVNAGSCGTNPTWSPKGDLIAFVSCVSENQTYSSRCQLMLVKADGSGLRPVAVVHDGADVAFSPDGTRMAYGYSQVTVLDEGELRTVNVDGSGDRLLVHVSNGAIGGPTWAPDGRSLLAVMGVFDADGYHTWLQQVGLDGRLGARLSGRRGLVFDPDWR